MKPEKIIAITREYDRLNQDFEDVVIQQVEKILDKAYEKLEKQILAAYSQHSENKSLLPIQRKLLILDQVKSYLNLINPDRAETIQTLIETMLEQSSQNGQKLAAAYLQGIGDLTLEKFSVVPIKAIAFQAQDSAARLRNYSERLRYDIGATVGLGLATGASVKTIASALRQQYGMMRARAEAVARTESNASSNRAIEAAYDEAEIRYVQLIATNDSSTCGYCAARAGNVYKLGTISVPLHVNDRCTLLPWSPDWQELGLTNDDWHKQFKSELKAKLKEQGQDPNYGQSPFEKANGIPTPEPVWKP